MRPYAVKGAVVVASGVLSAEEVERLQAASRLARKPLTWRYEGRTVDLSIALPAHGVAAITAEFAPGQADGATQT